MRVLALIKQAELVVVETFSTSGNISTDGLYTVRLIGGILAIAAEHRVPLVEHVPQVRYPYLMAAKAHLDSTRLSGRYSEHELDATAHLLAFEDRLQLGVEYVHAAHPDLHFSQRRAVGREDVHGGGKGPTTAPSTIRRLLNEN